MIQKWKEMGTSRVLEAASIFLFLLVAVVVIGYGAAADPSSSQSVLDAAIEAFAYAMPNRGWAPLKVYFSAFGSNDPDGSIVRYQWDLDANGSFETDATSADGYVDYVYSKPGNYTVTLQVTDDQGGIATASVTVTVSHPAASSVDYWNLFDDSQVRRVDLIVSEENWDRMWADPGAKIQVEADAIVFGERIDRIGLSFRGNFSLLNSGIKKPWKIDTDAFIEGQEFHNLKQLLFINNVGDPSMMLEKFAYDFLAFAGVPASHITFVEIWVDVLGKNEAPTFLGVYTLVERIDMKFVANRFGQDNKGGNLYKANHFMRGPADLVYYGDDIEDFPKPNGLYIYGKVNNEEEADYGDIVELTRVIDGVAYDTPEDFAQALEKVFNVDGFLRYMAVEIALMSWDIYPNTGNNFYLYNNPGTGKFEWLPWDQTWGGMIEHPLYKLPNDSFRLLESAPLYENVFQVERYRRTYAAYLDLFTRYRFNYEYVAAQGQSWYNLIEPYVKQGTGDLMYFSPSGMFTIQNFESSWIPIADLTRQRSQFIQTALTQEN